LAERPFARPFANLPRADLSARMKKRTHQHPLDMAKLRLESR
jgi:hypothetical protein